MFCFVDSASAVGFRYTPEQEKLSRGLYLDASSLEEDVLTLKIKLVGLPDQISGIGFNLFFDSKYLKFIDLDLLGNHEDEIILKNEEAGVLNFAISTKNNKSLIVDTDFMDLVFKIEQNGNFDIFFKDVYISTISNDILNRSSLDAIGGSFSSDIELPLSGKFYNKITPFTFFKYGSGVILFIILALYFYANYFKPMRKH